MDLDLQVTRSCLYTINVHSCLAMIGPSFYPAPRVCATVTFRMTMERTDAPTVPPLAVSVARKTLLPFAVLDGHQGDVFINGPTSPAPDALPQYLVTIEFVEAERCAPRSRACRGIDTVSLTAFCAELAETFPSIIAPDINEQVGRFLAQDVYTELSSYPVARIPCA